MIESMQPSPVQDDEAVLRQINVRIGLAERDGDAVWLDKVVAPQLGFRRVNGLFNSRSDSLAPLARGPKRETEIEKIEFYGDRAVVSFTVTVTSEQSVDRYHNLRLFVRNHGEWKLLGWANQRWENRSAQNRKGSRILNPRGLAYWLPDGDQWYKSHDGPTITNYAVDRALCFLIG